MKLNDTAAIIVAVATIFTTQFSDGLSTPDSRNNFRYSPYFVQSRAQMLNLLNHPLQLQLATGDLSMGSFQRLLRDRLVLLNAIQAAMDGLALKEEDTIDIIGIKTHHEEADEWLELAKSRGKTIIASPGIKCYTCGGDHLDIDCPNDLQESSQSVLALNSVLQNSGMVGAIAVLEGYSFACGRLLEALRIVTSSHENHNNRNINVYHGWLEVHAARWSQLAERCRKHNAKSGQTNTVCDDDASAAAYTACLSMLYNWIDMEAATTGIRADLNDHEITALMEALEVLEPGYAAQRDKHSSFVSNNIADVASSKANENAASAKVKAAAAYLAAKKRKEGL